MKKKRLWIKQRQSLFFNTTMLNSNYFGKLYEKPTIGDPIRPVEIEDIPRANKLLYATCIVGAILFFGLSVLLKTVL